MDTYRDKYKYQIKSVCCLSLSVSLCVFSIPLPSEDAFLQREKAELHRAALDDLSVWNARGKGEHPLSNVNDTHTLRMLNQS